MPEGTCMRRTSTITSRIDALDRIDVLDRQDEPVETRTVRSRHRTRLVAVVAGCALAMTSGVASASATPNTGSATRLALRQAGVSSGGAGGTLPESARHVARGDEWNS
jgi:hypothetical protein